VWYYQRNGECREDSVSDIGADEYFYGHPSVSPVDESFKKIEGDLGAMVAKLRGLTTSTCVSEPLIPKLFAHLSVRTKNLRVTFGAAAEELMRRMREDCDSSEGREYLRRLLDQQMEPELQRLLTQEPYRSLLSLAPPQMREQVVSQARKAVREMNVSHEFGELLDYFLNRTDFAEMIRDAHIKSLSKLNDGVPQRIDALASLQWHVLVEPIGSFVLGDIAVIAQPSASSPLQSPLKEKDTPHMILLPISDRHLIVGTVLHSLPAIDANTINLASVELSAEFFIANQSTAKEHGYLTHLGSRASFLTDDEFREVIQDVFAAR